MRRKINSDGLLLCELQAKTFELSCDLCKCSSEIFIRRFMNGEITEIIDDESIIMTTLQSRDVIAEIENQYGESEYGTIKFTKNEMYWIGYIYRYYCFTYGRSSKQAYRQIKPRELRDVYLPFHTLSPENAIERILEAKGLPVSEEDELRWQLDTLIKFRKIK
ncbi:MAG: antitoxin [Erysipelotrichaceae bacterium]|nr:antitoxin [Erysipelotrichaceae bacterium]